MTDPTAYVALLRGINTGRRRLAMAELRAWCETAGYGAVRTYVQSGNVVCTSTLSAAEVRDDLSRRLSEHCGYEVAVVVRSAAEMAEVVARCPYDTNADPTRLVVHFADVELGPEGLGDLDPSGFGDESFTVDDRQIYLWLPGGQGRSVLVAALLGTPAGRATTARNWRTVTTLASWAAEASRTGQARG